MRAPLYVALIALTACGGKKQSDTNPVDNTETTDTSDGDGMTYGGMAEEEEPPPEPEPEPEPEPPSPPDLSGAWDGPCSPTAADPKVNGRFTFTFTGETWTLDMQRYSDAACTKRTWAIQGTGTYTIGEMAGDTGGWNADVTLTSYTLTADDKATAKKLSKTCGVKLKAKKPLDISAKGCPKLMIRPIAECGHMYDVVAVKGGRLFFGAHPADNDTCTEEKRPAALAEHGLVMHWNATGLTECDAYAARLIEYSRCEKLPDEARAAALEGLRAMAAGWGDLSTIPEDVKKQTNDACKQGTDALNQGMQAMGC